MGNKHSRASPFQWKGLSCVGCENLGGHRYAAMFSKRWSACLACLQPALPPAAYRQQLPPFVRVCCELEHM